MLGITHGRGHPLVTEAAQALLETEAEIAHIAQGQRDD